MYGSFHGVAPSENVTRGNGQRSARKRTQAVEPARVRAAAAASGTLQMDNVQYSAPDETSLTYLLIWQHEEY